MSTYHVKGNTIYTHTHMYAIERWTMMMTETKSTHSPFVSAGSFMFLLLLFIYFQTISITLWRRNIRTYCMCACRRQALHKRYTNFSLSHTCGKFMMDFEQKVSKKVSEGRKQIVSVNQCWHDNQNTYQSSTESL